MSKALRDVSLLFPDEQVVCPRGHPVKKDFWLVGEEPGGGLRCKHKPPPNGITCGVLFYWLLVPGGYHIGVEVTSEELQHMESQHMSARQVRDFLGLRWGIKR
jgi:hypothetical protein